MKYCDYNPIYSMSIVMKTVSFEEIICTCVEESLPKSFEKGFDYLGDSICSGVCVIGAIF